MKILIATDGSEFGEAAVKAVAERSWPEKSEIRLLTVIEHSPLNYISSGEYSTDLTEPLNELRDVSEKIVLGAAQVLKEAGLTVSHTVREGAVAEEIIDEAKEWGADLIVVGTHGRRGLSRFLLGSVAQRVATHAPCSVEIIRIKNTESKN